jgi:type I restriction enzyme S subunit
MSYKRIGDYIRLVSNRNSDLAITNLLGVNIYKNFMPSVANTSGVDLSKYKIIRKGQFATNIMHVNRDEILPVALYHNEVPAIVSPAYMTFEVIDENELLPEFLMMEFQRPEFDRRAWTYCDSSVRGGLEWERFCDIEIPIPHIDEQLKFVALYNSLLTNQKTYESSLADLQLICDTFIEQLKKDESSLKQLGPYITQISERNENKKHLPVQGVSNSRTFIETKANTTSLDFSNYKIVRNGNFAYNPSRLNIGSIALRSGGDCIVSPMYVVFEITKKQELIPEYLNLWFTREAFCHYVWFYAFGSVRDTFDFNLMEEVVLPIPNIKVQEAIVTIYHTLETRKRINEQLKNTIKPLCPVLMRGVVESMTVKPKRMQTI